MSANASDYFYLWKPKKLKKKPIQAASPLKKLPVERHPLKPATVYRLFDASGVLLYVGCTTADVDKRLSTHHCQSQSWWTDVARVEQVHYERHGEALLAERRAIWHERPAHNLVHSRAGNIKPEPWSEDIRAQHLRDADLLDASGIESPHLVRLSGKIPRQPYRGEIVGGVRES